MSESFAGIGCTHLRYHRWALEQYFAVLEQLTEQQLHADHHVSHGSLYETLTHLCRADTVWSSRLTGEPAKPPQPAANLRQFKAAWFHALDRLAIWAGSLSEEGWFAAIEYLNSKGEPFRTPPWQAVLHLVNHGTAHRGQIAAILRQIGVAPPNSDLINFYRLKAD